MQRKVTLALLSLAAGIPGSCSSSFDEDLRPSVATVYGLVHAEAQEPPANAQVAIEAFRATCGAGEPLAYDRAVTDVRGFYRRVMCGPHVRRFDACVTVRVTPPPASHYREATRSGAMVTFMY